ncbi:Wzz/FepE/Etk N-terminal domain-containing protein [Altererythrobacter sp. KTW20L]|uniref:XrtA system polysaccharide chain length determinant n=1 Tax=Altererythrobacter sp. KTW20L TaxID=2942210 RepID=UPI0020BD82FE|nr:XrtA system polysaccharide chain length determinant [Altererythrobacter sp. KTW20L]MCL6251872.1 Wzz/FepE/Etk N-terminal domain-containing protein [Altererythrobacter sp. KTW20L]
MNQLLEEVRAALWSVWNRRWLALGVAWALCLAGWLVVALIPNTYESEARIFVQLDDVLAEQIGIGAQSRQRSIDRVRQTLVSSVNLEKVVRSTQLGDGITDARDMERAVANLADEIKVAGEGENLFEITATSGRSDLSDSENAQLAQTVVQRMIDIFREENLGGSRGDMTSSIDFINQQLAARQRELEEAEQRRLEFEALYPELIGGTAGLQQQLAGSRAELRSIEADLAAAESALAAIDGQISGTPRTLITAEGGGPRAALAQAEATLAQYRSQGLTDQHPDVVTMTRQIATLRERAAADNGQTGTQNPVYSSLVTMRSQRLANVQALESRSAALRAEISSIMSSQSQEPGVSAEAQRISRDYEVLRTQYEELLRDREQLRLRGQVESERSAIQFEVVDPPSTPRSPAAPNRPLLLVGVLLLGLGAGAGSAFALSKLGSTFATASQLERTFDLPVIGTISHTVTEAGKALRARQTRYFAAASGALGVLFVILLGVEFVQRGLLA